MDLLKDNIGKLYMKFLFPSLFSALVTTIYSFVDTIAIGQGVGADGAAACAIIYPIFGIASLFGFLCGIGGKYVRQVQRPLLSQVLMILLVVVAGIINSFVVGVATFVWYQIAVMGTEGSFWSLAAINFTSRLATKPLTIVVSALLVYAINRAAYRPVISRIMSRHRA